jgi:flagellar motility protein MotE (MotC chaperone)
MTGLAAKPAGQVQKRAKALRVPRLRLMPLVMIGLLATMSVKVTHLWEGIAVSVGKESQAQAQPANQQSANQQQANQQQAGQQPAGQQTAPAQSAVSGSVQAGQAATQTAQIQPQPNAAAPTSQAVGPAAGTDGQVMDLLAAEAKRKIARDPFNYTDEEVDVLQQLAKRRQELDQRARQLDEREALVKAAEQRMEQKMAELRALQATVEELLKKRDAADEQQLASLVKIYENMKPQAAAQVFEEMDMDVLLDVVSRMKERKVAPILAQVSPTRAKELTYELMQRRQLPIPQ